MSRNTSAILALSVLSLLTACGGGGSVSKTITFAGQVIDGYIEGAIVCLDLNANLSCDSGEPTAVSKSDGTYSLDVSQVDTEKLKTAHLLTVVPATAKDADDAGKTIAEAGKSGFSLLAPAAAYVKSDGSSVVGAVISPLTTLVSHEMITSNNTLDTSEKYVRERLSLAAGTDLRQDFVANKDTTLAGTAQMLATAMGEVKAAVLADSTSAATDKQAVMASVSYVQTQAAELQKSYSDAKTANSAAKPVELVKTALKTPEAKPVPADLAAAAKKITDSTMSNSVVSILEQGIYVAESGRCSQTSAAIDCIAGRYEKIQGNGGQVTVGNSNWKNWNGSTWVPETNSDQTLFLSATGWTSETICASGQSASYVAQSNGSATFKLCNGNTYNVTTRVSDASGKSLAGLGLQQLWYPFNTAATLSTSEANFANPVMPSGSTLYLVEISYMQDSYALYANSKIYYYTGGLQKSFTSLADYINAYPTSEQGPRAYVNGLNFPFDTGGITTGGTLTFWSVRASTVASKKIGSASYEIRQVMGKELLMIQAKDSGYDKGTLAFFPVNEGLLYQYQYRQATV